MKNSSLRGYKVHLVVSSKIQYYSLSRILSSARIVVPSMQEIKLLNLANLPITFDIGYDVKAF